MKAFDIGELKKTAKVKELEANRSYSQIHRSPLRSSTQQNLNIGQSSFLSRWGKNIDSKGESSCPWVNVGQGIFTAAVGEEHVLILNNKNQCFGYGNNTYGQLAPESELITRPTPITAFKEMKVVAVYCGAYHSFIQNSKGQIFAFGFNLKGQLGVGSFDNKKKPVLVYSMLPGGSKNPKSNFFVETSEYKKKLRKSKDQNTELMNITNLLSKIEGEEDSKSPIFHLMADETVIKLACGPLHTAAITNKQRLFTCGYGEKYSLGNGRNKTTNDFAEVRIKTNGKIEKIEAGITSLGYISGGRAYICGTIGEKVFELFTQINNSEEFIEMKICERSVIFLTRKGDLFQMGEFQKENGDKSFSEVLKKIDRMQNIKQIFNGVNHFFAVSESKTLFGWGDNSSNQITGLADVKSIPCGKTLKIPICFNQTINIIAGNQTTFLLSSKPLDIEFSVEKSQKVDVNSFNENEGSTPVQKYKLKSSTQKYTLSNICGTEESRIFVYVENMLNQMGIQPRMFNCNMEIDFAELIFESQISEGGYGIIYKGIWRETVVAIKMFKIQSDNAIKDFFSQCAAMEALRHPNIVMFLGACTKAPNFAIVLQFCAKGSLWATIQNQDFPLSWDDRRKFALQTARGVNYLHNCDPPIIHRDLKSLNLLLDDSYKVKLADFGWTKGLDNYMTGKIGTYQWMAPEVIASQKYSEKADVFSYGIILWEILSRQPPFKHLTGIQVSLEVMNNDMRPPIPKKAPEPYVKLMKRCWDREPSKRPSFKQIIKELQTMKL